MDDVFSQRHYVVIHYVLGPLVDLSCLICVASVYAHLTRPGGNAPHALTIRILLMVPIYSYVAWGALTFRVSVFAKVLVAFEKVYECITLFAFTQLLVHYLGGVEQCYVTLVTTQDGALRLAGDERCDHIAPVRWLPARALEALSWRPPSKFLRRALGAVLLYVPLLLACFVSTSLAWSLLSREAFVAVDRICSALVFTYTSAAMYGLIVFYHAFAEKLLLVRPVLKLLSIKALLILTTWQGFGVKFAKAVGALDYWVEHSRSHYKPDELAEAIVSGLVIIEMFLLSVAHVWVYPATEPLYGDRNATACDVDDRVCCVLDFTDIWEFYRDLSVDFVAKPPDAILGLETA